LLSDLIPPVLVYGLGRSGRAVLSALRKRGIECYAVDQASSDSEAGRENQAFASSLGIEMISGFSGFSLPGKFGSVVVSPGIDHRRPELQAAARQGIEILSEPEFAARLTDKPIFATTGTNGKSTVTVLVHLLLRSHGVGSVLCGNLAGSGYEERTVTEAIETEAAECFTAEISSFQLEWVHRFAPKIGAITNITPDHLDRYDSFDEYAATKMRLFAHQRAEDFALVPAQDERFEELWQRLAPEARSHLIWWGSRESGVFDNGTSLVQVGSGEYPWRELPLASLPLRKNSVLAWTMANMACESLGIHWQPDLAWATLREFRGLTHRMETLAEREGITVVNNSMCTNPAALICSTEGIDRPLHLIIGGVTKGNPFEPVKAHLERIGAKPYLFGRDARLLQQVLGTPDPVYPTLHEAFQAAASAARPGDVVMLAPGCASMDQFRDFRHRGEVFREVVAAWLEQ
jgi:UDP-N-acetylmuramoylalanine--D-glutamate ligase